MPHKSTVKRTRAPNLDDEGIERIVLVLDSWSEPKLTWSLLIDYIHRSFNILYTRQALDRHPRISQAYQFRKKNQRIQTPEATPDDERIKALQIEVARLKRENNQLLEQFVRWISNVRRIEQKSWEHDWREHRDEIRKELDKPLSKVDRGGSAVRRHPGSS